MVVKVFFSTGLSALFTKPKTPTWQQELKAGGWVEFEEGHVNGESVSYFSVYESNEEEPRKGFDPFEQGEEPVDPTWKW